MVVSRSPAAPQAVEGQPLFDGVRLPLQGTIKDMGVNIDRGLRCHQDIQSVARQQTSERVSALHRVSGCLDSRGILTVQGTDLSMYRIWCLCLDVWSRHLHLDMVQGQAFCLLGEKAEIPASIMFLKHCWDVSALTVCHKAQVLCTQYTIQLCLLPHPAHRTMQQALTGHQSVVVPLSHITAPADL